MAARGWAERAGFAAVGLMLGLLGKASIADATARVAAPAERVRVVRPACDAPPPAAPPLALAALTAARPPPGPVRPWLDDAELGDEEPGTWSALVEDAFARCDGPFSVEQIDCTEYPCVAALRVDGEVDLDAPAAIEDVVDCPSFAALAERYDAQGLIPVEVRCPDGPRTLILYAAGDTTGAAYLASGIPAPEADDLFGTGTLWNTAWTLSRRSQALDPAFVCED